LISHNFLSVPVFSKIKKKYFGFIDMMDIVKYIVSHFGKDRLSQDKPFWDLVKEEKAFETKTVNQLMTYPLSNRNPFKPVLPSFSILCVFELLARYRSLHRVPVIDVDRQMLNLITQSQLVSFLAKHISLLGSKRSKEIVKCQHFFKHVISVSEETRTIDAFEKMVESNVNGIAVVNEKGALTGNLSVRDLKVISPDARLFWRLDQSVKATLARIQKESDPKHPRPRRVVAAKSHDTLGSVIETLAVNRMHRVYIVDSKKMPVGIVTLRDILLEVLSESADVVQRLNERIKTNTPVNSEPEQDEESEKGDEKEEGKAENKTEDQVEKAPAPLVTSPPQIAPSPGRQIPVVTAPSPSPSPTPSPEIRTTQDIEMKLETPPRQIPIEDSTSRQIPIEESSPPDPGPTKEDSTTTPVKSTPTTPAAVTSSTTAPHQTPPPTTT